MTLRSFRRFAIHSTRERQDQSVRGQGRCLWFYLPAAEESTCLVPGNSGGEVRTLHTDLPHSFRSPRLSNDQGIPVFGSGRNGEPKPVTDSELDVGTSLRGHDGRQLFRIGRVYRRWTRDGNKKARSCGLGSCGLRGLPVPDAHPFISTSEATAHGS